MSGYNWSNTYRLTILSNLPFGLFGSIDVINEPGFGKARVILDKETAQVINKAASAEGSLVFAYKARELYVVLF
jgi:hypothetical protein